MTAALTLTRKFAAAPDRVYRAWTDPAQFARWIGPVGVPCEVQAMNPVEGGTYRLAMRPPSGTLIRITGQFTRLSPHDRIDFTWIADWEPAADGPQGGLVSTVTVHLRPADGGTEMTFHHHLPYESFVQGHQRGWTSTFDKLQTLLET